VFYVIGQMVLSNLVQSVGVCRRYLAHIISCDFIVQNIPLLVAAAFVGRGALLPLLMFLTLRGLMITYAYKHWNCGQRTSAACTSGLLHIIFFA